MIRFLHFDFYTKLIISTNCNDFYRSCLSKQKGSIFQHLLSIHDLQNILNPTEIIGLAMTALTLIAHPVTRA